MSNGRSAEFLRQIMEKRKLPSGTSNFRALLYRYKKDAQKKGVKFDLSEKQFKELTQQNCFYCGAEPSQVARCVTFFKGQKHERHGDYVYNGIDRLNSSEGYMIDNSVSCCKHCNVAKRDRSVGEFLNWVRKIYKHRLTEKGFKKGGNIHLLEEVI